MSKEERANLIAAIVARIIDRCREDEDGCLVWGRSLNSNGYIYISFNYRKYSARRVMYEHVHGPIPKGRNVTYSCGNPLCLSHQKSLTSSQKNREAAKNGAWKSPEYRARMALVRRQKSRLSDDDIADIRNFEGNIGDIAEAKGITREYANMIRRNAARKDYSSPFAGLAA